MSASDQNQTVNQNSGFDDELAGISAVRRRSRPQIELIISKALRYGVLASSALIVVGAALVLLSAYPASAPGSPAPTLNAMLSVGSEGTQVFHTPHEVLIGLSHGNPNAVISLGLLLLMATPIVPLVLSLVSFALDRDVPFVLITTFVLAVLAVGYTLGAII